MPKLCPFWFLNLKKIPHFRQEKGYPLQKHIITIQFKRVVFFYLAGMWVSRG